jgi:hypothetical protein
MKKIFLALSICLISQVLVAQVGQGIHLNFFFGMSNYSGDLQEKRFTFSQSHLAGGVGLSFDVAKQFSIRTAIKIGKVSADDAKGRNAARNLNFFTNIAEFALDGQYFFKPLGEHPLTPYIFLGLAVYHFNPYTFDTTGKKYFLHPLGTEGEGYVPGRKEYKLTELAIPMGAGVKLSMTENLNVGFEIGIRRLFTDYLDDVSSTYVDPNAILTSRGAKALELAYRGGEVKGGSDTYPTGKVRGNPIYKDWYYFTGLTLSYKLRNDLFNKSDDGARKRKKGKLRQWDCPGRVL